MKHFPIHPSVPTVLLIVAGILTLVSCSPQQSAAQSSVVSPQGKASTKVPSQSLVLDMPCMAPCGRVGGAAYGNKANLDKDFRWHKKNLEVRFFGGSPQLRQRVMDSASLWSKYSGVTFVETTAGKGDIRVAFDPKGGHWSHLGNYAEHINRKRATMNLQLSDASDDEELRAVVLHEFGHAIGFLHEHRRGDSGLVWNEEEVYRYYTGYPNFWSPKMVKEQILDPNPNPSNAIFSQYDPKSIMHYPIPGDFLKKGKATGWNKNLSYNDKAAVKYSYPR